MAWRKRIKRDPNTFPSEAFRHPFIDRDGRERREFFSGRGLAIMQEYRKDWQAALRLNDYALLARYERLRIYNTSGERVYPAVVASARASAAGEVRWNTKSPDLAARTRPGAGVGQATIRATRSRMTQRERNRFDADLHYAHGEARLAA